jgi:Mn2+/Fe2+ NRAMP family transporter
MPSLPDGSSLLVLGLIGTTVVPYNIFLGSGIAGGQKLSDLRFGLSIAVILGGLISMGVMVVGTAVTGSFSFETLAGTLSGQLGHWAGLFFAFGLFAAGFSSAITAPLAAAVTARSLFSTGEIGSWHEQSWRYRCVWMGVLLTGVLFGLLDIRPIPAIIVAQALNGILLPFVAVFLFLVVNDRRLMGPGGINFMLINIIMGIIVIVTIVLGVLKTAQAITSALNLPMLEEKSMMMVSAAITLLIAVPIARSAVKRRR